MMREEEERVVPSKKLLLLILVFFCGERETEKYSIEKRFSSKKEHTPTEEYDASSGENFSLFLFLLARRRRRKSFGG